MNDNCLIFFRPIIAPMLNASIGETYSNFWGGMDEMVNISVDYG